jgi:hypothetical protein
MDKTMKILSRMLALSLGLALMTMFSCNKDKNEFGSDSFNLDTLIIMPSVNIENAFTIGWGVTCVGFPTFFTDMYLSTDTLLDNSDLKISTTSSVDGDATVYAIDETQFYRINPVTGTNRVVFLHNEKSSDPNATGWNQSAEIINPTGTTKYIIGRFYNIAGAQITYKRSRMAVPVSFK